MREQSKHISFRITESNLKAIDKIATEHNFDRSRVLNETLKSHLPNLQKKLELNEVLSTHTDLLKNVFHSIQHSFSNLNQLLQIAQMIKNHPNTHHPKWLEVMDLNIKIINELKKECLALNNHIVKLLEIINE